MDEKRKALYQQLYEDYLQTLPDKINNLNLLIKKFGDSFSADDLDQLIRSIHSMKGSAGSYGHHFLSNMAKNWETLILEYQQNSLNESIISTSEKGLEYIKNYQADPASFKEDKRLDFF